MHRDPEIATMMGQLIIMGGSVDGIGNATACAEFNVFYDPESAQAVYESPTTKTIIPLDVTRETILSLDLFNELPAVETRSGQFLHHVLHHMFRAHRAHLGLEGIQLHDAVAVVAALQPELFQTIPLHGEVETKGKLTSGLTIFDRRSTSRDRANMEVAIHADSNMVKQCIIRGLTRLS